jgi:hypothetical protein
MSNVAYLPGCKPKRRGKENKVADALRGLLALAERGELTGIAFVAIKRDTVRYGVVDILDIEDAIDACASLKGAILGNAPSWIKVK